MVETQLTPELVREGAALVEKLDASGVSPDAAFWLYFPDTRVWKLVLVAVKVAQNGPRVVYRSVQKALQSLRNEIVHLSLDDVVVAKPDMPVVALLSRAISTRPGIGGIRFSRNAINGQMIDDAYIYRLKRPAA